MVRVNGQFWDERSIDFSKNQQFFESMMKIDAKRSNHSKGVRSSLDSGTISFSGPAIVFRRGGSNAPVLVMMKLISE
jgi:hypothetical protein